MDMNAVETAAVLGSPSTPGTFYSFLSDYDSTAEETEAVDWESDDS